MHSPANANGGTATKRGDGRSTAAAVALAAVLARLPALLSWWCLDDWGQLARAAGRLPAEPGVPARRLSQHLWWSLTWPVLDLHAAGHACLRILLHAIAAVTVTRLARRAGLGQAAQLAAGLLFAITPIAFTPLYWASGIQELLGGVLALLAVERWLAGGNASAIEAGLLGAASIFSKECGLGLPLFFAGWILWKRAGPAPAPLLRWIVTALLAAVAVFEGSLVWRNFATGPGEPYAVGGPLVMLGNLGKFGWWLPTPGPVFTAEVHWAEAGAGLAVLAAWGAYGVIAWRRGRRLPLAAWACALLSLGPALPLVHRAQPYMGYVAAAAWALTLATLVPARWRLRRGAAVALVVVAVIWGQFDLFAWIGNKRADGLPADPVVRAEQTARVAARGLLAMLPSGAATRPFTLVIYQPPMGAGAAERDEKRAADTAPIAVETRSYKALAGPYGAAMLLGQSGRAQWVNSLLGAPTDAFVVGETASGFQAGGSLRDGLLYAAELAISAGDFERAMLCLMRADSLDAAHEMRIPDPSLLGLAHDALRSNLESFDAWLRAAAAESRVTSEQARRAREFTQSLLGG